MYTFLLGLACLFTLLTGVSSCKSNTVTVPKSVAGVLVETANRKELEKVIDHYSFVAGDSLKLKAAFFLIENLRGQYHYEGKPDVLYDDVFYKVDSITEYKRRYFNENYCRFIQENNTYNPNDSIRKYQRKTWDSLQKVNPLNLEAMRRVEDWDTITSEILIENIDQAFIAWKFPWAQKLSFADFCEYVLPYKVMHEKPTIWRKEAMRKFEWIKSKLKDSTSLKEVCYLINTYLKENFYLDGAKFNYPFDLSFRQLEMVKMGKCSDANTIAAYMMRGMGIPIAVDDCPFWGNKNKGHNWDALCFNGKNLNFVGSESFPGLDKIDFAGSKFMKRRRPKVFRHSYSLQFGSLASIERDVNIPSLFEDNHLTDITGKYIPVSNVKLNLSQIPFQAKYVYISVFNNSDWQICDWSLIQNHSAAFKNLGRDIVYLPVFWIDGEQIPAAEPFILDNTGKVLKLSAQIHDFEKVTVKMKYPEDKSNKIIKGKTYELFYWDEAWASLGEITAVSDSILYKQVPKNALFWIRNKKEGFQERIFTVRNGGQQWW